ncbi:hypothetical protein ABZ464_49690 [Streptomyces sp. NPDC005820]|uniref:hypothetical protein n=1 Tax=Streptomyces sp. NPDC005820 TaxID=3157069 RepID=UPI0033D62FCA
MARPAVRDGSDPKAVRDTRVLIDCLQELVRGAVSKTIRNCDKYLETVWLADVPDGTVRRAADADPRIMVVKHRPPKEPPQLPAILHGRVSAEAAATAGPQAPGLIDDTSNERQPADEVQAGVEEDQLVLESGSSAERKAYEAWAAKWMRWSQDELAAEPQRRLHQRLYRMAKRVEQDSDTFEVVLAVGLLQLGADRPSARVRRHIVTTPVTLTVEPASINVTVSLLPEHPGRLEDTEFLSESDGYTSELLGVVRSAVEDQLSSKDLRRSLLTYMVSPPPPYTHPHQPANVSADRHCEPFDSLFEQRVFLCIKERGYDVVPQWEVNGKRIDLVVTGGHGRLAVECDGSPYHSTPKQIQDDAERERELRRAGWTFWRIRSSAFALSPEEALEPLWERLTELGIHPRTVRETTDDDALTDLTWTPVGLAEAEPDEDADPYDGEPDEDSEGH